MLRWVILLTALTSLGCASGPKAEDVAFPDLEPGKSRIVFYRMPSPLGSMYQPSVLVDGEVIGRSEPGYFSYADIPPGRHFVECSVTEPYRIGLHIFPGATAYIETTSAMAIVDGGVKAEVKNEAEAMEKISKLRFRQPIDQPDAAPTTQPETQPPTTQNGLNQTG